MAAWRWPYRDHRLYAAEGLLAFGGPNLDLAEAADEASMQELWLAADEPGRLAYLAKVEGV